MSKSKRIKPAPVEIETRAEMVRHVGLAAGLQTGLNSLKTAMEARLQDIRAEYESLIDSRERDLERVVLALEAWAKANPDEFPANRKSLETVHGTIGFRTGMPQVRKSRKFSSLQAVVEAMRALPWARKYIKRAPDALNKEAFLADRETLTAAQLNEVGLAIVQEETFYVDPKGEPLEQGVQVA